MKKYYIGIDGGGTKTSYVLIDENEKIIKEFKNGATTYDSVPRSQVIDNLKEGIKAVLPNDGKVVSLFGGFGGVVCEKDTDDLFDIIRSFNYFEDDTLIETQNDIYNAFYSTFKDSGIAIIVGTGSVAFGRDYQGNERRLGGFGYVEGDDGSGYFLSIQTLRVLAKMIDGVYPFNDTFKEFANLLNITDKTSYIKYIMNATRGEIASSTKFIIEHSNDNYINEILHKGGKEFALLIDSIIKQIPNINNELTIIGSAGKNPLYRDIILEEVHKLNPDIKYVENKLEAVMGSAIYAKAKYHDLESLSLIPYFSYRVWGGTALTTLKGNTLKDHLGEAWILSTIEGSSSYTDGDYLFRTDLNKMYKKYPSLFLKEKNDKFPLLIKLIDAKDDLSIQVHPDAEVGKIFNGESKNECWYILSTSNHELYLGTTAKTKQDVIDALDNHHIMDIIKVEHIDKDDFAYIGSGTIHAIKGGTFLIEVQQNSDTTYRLYDYDRLDNGKLRQLHVEEGKAAIKLDADNFLHKNTKDGNLVTNEDFSVDKITIDGEKEYKLDRSCEFIFVLDGEIKVNGKLMKKYESKLILMTSKTYKVSGKGTFIKAKY